MLLTDLSWPAINELSRDTPIVFPVAALEQHGGHLPVFTDSMLLGEVVRRANQRLDSSVLFAPLTWLGNSDHHLDFPGTLSAAPRLYLGILKGLAENFISYGFKRIVFLNGHGGNITPGKQAVFELRQELRKRSDLLLLFATYWEFGKPTDSRTDLVQKDMGHACEWETSMIMRLTPHLVGPLDQLQPVSSAYGFEPAYRGWITKERTATGHIGDPRHATPDKGEHLFATFTDGVTRFLEQVTAWDGESWFKP